MTPTKIKISKGKAGVNRTNQTVKITDDIYLVIGFEVNLISSAYNAQTNTQNLDVNNGGDYGHAFFFTVKNGKVVTFFSFGPKGLANTNWIADQVGLDGYVRSRPGDTCYLISEVTRLFKFKIGKSQLEKIQTNANNFTYRVSRGWEKYTVYTNDTCAETAKQILDDSGVTTPNGKGRIATPSGAANFILNGIPLVNPYSWYTQFRNKYGPGIKFRNTGVIEGTPNQELSEYWVLIEGEDVEAQIPSINKDKFHGDLTK